MNEVIGLVLLAMAVMLLVAQLSFDRYDLAAVRVPPNREAQNLIGIGGAYYAYATFCPLGLAAYLVPWLVERWIDKGIELAITSRDYSLVESLVWRLSDGLDKYPELLKIATELHKTSPAIAKAMKSRVQSHGAL